MSWADTSTRDRGLRPGWWTLILLGLIAAIIAFTALAFTGSLVSVVPVTVRSERAGLVMDSGSKVKLRGVEVGKVASVNGGGQSVAITVDLYPDAVKFIPANVDAQIRATTVFGAKYVDLVYPEKPSPQHIKAGAVLRSRNVTSEANTVFQNLVLVLEQVEPSKLNGVLTTLADAVRGKGERIGQAAVDANEVLAALNPRMDVVRQDIQSLAGVSDTYSAAAPDLLRTLSSFSTTSTTLTNQASELDAALMGTIGLSRSGISLLGPNMGAFSHAINGLAPTTNLLFKYNPEYTCTLKGAYWLLTDAGGYEGAGGNGRTAILDATLGWGRDVYRYPDNLPIIAAKGGPDGKPGCGSLPRPDLNWPVRALITNTGWGTGVDYRPNAGITHPGYVSYFPVTGADPSPPFLFADGAPPSTGPVTYPGAPPYGAPLYAPDGTPLWAPPPPGVPPPPVPGVPNPPPPYGTGSGPGARQ